MQDRNQNPATCSTERKGDNPCQGSRWKQQQIDVCERSQAAGIISRHGKKNNLKGKGWTSTACKSPTMYVDKVFENLRQTLRLSSCTLDAKTNVLIWGLLVSTTTKTSVHLGLQYQEDFFACRNTNFEELKTSFDITQRLIVEQSFEILNVSTMLWSVTPWMRSTLCHDQVIKWAKAKIHVYSDSALREGKINDHSEANEKWKSQIKEFQQSNEYTELSGIDGQPIEFEWNFPKDSHRLRFSERSRKIWKLDERIILFMLM